MKIIIERKKTTLNESSLSRTWQWIEAHECANISASRNDASDLTYCLDSVMSELDNKERNRILMAALMKKGYGVTEMRGSYIENYKTEDATEVSETSLFVVNLEDTPGFADAIIGFGKQTCQDSVLIIPQGGEGAYLYGTNNFEWPGLDKKIFPGKLGFGKEAEFMTKVHGRPYTFTTPEDSIDESLQTYSKASRMGKWAITVVAQPLLKG